MVKTLKSAVRTIAHTTGRLSRLYRRLASDPHDYAEFLRKRGGFFAIGRGCYISPGANIQDRPLVRIGDNVWIADCTIVGHDGTIGMINEAYGVRLDKVGKVDIRDNVSICHGAIILPGVTIGPNAIVGAGSVVSRDVPPNTIVSGVPAKRVGRVDMMVQMLKIQNREYPWRHLIEARSGAYDAALQPELTRLRVEYFYGQERTKPPRPDTGPVMTVKATPAMVADPQQTAPEREQAPANVEPEGEPDPGDHASFAKARKTAGG